METFGKWDMKGHAWVSSSVKWSGGSLQGWLSCVLGGPGVAVHVKFKVFCVGGVTKRIWRRKDPTPGPSKWLSASRSQHSHIKMGYLLPPRVLRIQ